MKEGLNRAVKRGVAWALIERGTLQTLNFASSVVLARLLLPRDFGVMGIAILCTGLATRLMQFGFGMALVQRETIREDHVAALFVITMIINGCLCAGLILVSPMVGSYFRDPMAGSVLAVMSWNFVIRAIGVCPTAILRRQMNFRVMSVGSIVDAVVKLSLAVTLAFRGMGVWSLVIGELAGGASGKIYQAIGARWKPSLRTSRAAIRDLFGFGTGISIKSTFVYLFENVDNYIVGKRLGTSSLGFYEKAYNLMDLPVKEFGAQIGPVLFPVFARIHRDAGRLRAACRKMILALSILGYPLFASLVILAPSTVRLVYGPRWTDAIVPFQILCLSGFPRMLTQVTSTLMNATGSVNPEVRRRGFVFAILVVGAFWGSRWGLPGVATAVALVNVTTMVLMLFLLMRVTPVTLADLLAPQRLPALSAAAMIAAELLSLQGLRISHITSPFMSLLIPAGVGAAAYSLCLFLLRDRTLTSLAHEIRGDVGPFLDRLRGSNRPGAAGPAVTPMEEEP